MKKIRLFMSLVAFIATSICYAQTDAQSLVVWQKNGQKIYVALSEEPRTTFEDGLLVITTNTVQTTYQLSNIIRYTYEGNIPDIGPSSIGHGDLLFRQGKDSMSFDGLPDDTRIDLYSLDGKLLSTQQAHSGQTAVVSLVSHPKGTYIIKVNDTTYKFIKR